MVGNAARAAVLVAVATVMVIGCAAFASAPHNAGPPTRKPRPTLSPPSSEVPIGNATPSSNPPSVAPPPFPDFREGVMLVDQAGIFSPATEKAAGQRIADIASGHDAVVVVYTQYKPGADARATRTDAKALKLRWRISRGLVVMWNTTSEQCTPGSGGDAQIQLYADTKFAATRLSDLKREKIFQDLMVPLLQDCKLDEALLAALDGIDEEIRTRDPEPDPGAPPALDDACSDDGFKLFGHRWEQPFEWWFNDASVPDEYDADAVLDVLLRSAENITSGYNDCGLPDRIDAEATYMGTTTRESCVDDKEDGFNVVGFAEMAEDQDPDGDTLAFVCRLPGWKSVREVDMVINSAIPWAISKDECGWFSELLEPTTTHEFGHVFGLNHVSEEKHWALTMSPMSNGPCIDDETSLGLGDIMGLEEMY